jgi:hypothetical protein
MRSLNLFCSEFKSKQGHAHADLRDLKPCRLGETVTKKRSQQLAHLSGCQGLQNVPGSMGVPLFALELAAEQVEGTHSPPRPGYITTRSAEALFMRRQAALPRS